MIEMTLPAPRPPVTLPCDGYWTAAAELQCIADATVTVGPRLGARRVRGRVVRAEHGDKHVRLELDAAVAREDWHCRTAEVAEQLPAGAVLLTIERFSDFALSGELK